MLSVLEQSGRWFRIRKSQNVKREVVKNCFFGQADRKMTVFLRLPKSSLKVILLDCGHVCACADCAAELLRINQGCPVCRSCLNHTPTAAIIHHYAPNTFLPFQVTH